MVPDRKPELDMWACGEDREPLRLTAHYNRTPEPGKLHPNQLKYIESKHRLVSINIRKYLGINIMKDVRELSSHS